MTPRQRIVFNLVLATGVLTVLAVFLVMTAFDKRYVLGGIFFAVVASVTGYFYAILSREFVKKNQLASELHTARQMQMSLMPKEDPRVEGFDIAGVSLPAEEVGGDLYDYFEPAGATGSVGIALADVSGKAMKAAIATVLVSGMMRSEYRRSARPSEILSSVNRSLKGALESHGFVAMQVLVLDTTGSRAVYANGGQVFPLLLRIGKISYLAETALPLGVTDDTQYGEEAVPLERGDTLLLLSDGITEAMNENRQMFGFERLEAVILALPRDFPARAMADSILSQVRAFAGKAKQHDDMTLVVVKAL